MNKNLYVFFGPPGAGKSTQALLLQEKLNFQYVSWGKISREIALGRGPYKDYAEMLNRINKENRPFPNGFIFNIIRQEIQNNISDNNTNGLILDGFPRRIEEAKELIDILKEFKINLKALIKFNIDHNTVRQRVTEREYCPKCGKFYNKVIRPKISKICDTDGTKLIKRIDDKLETVKNRFDLYIEESIDAFNLLASCAENSFDVNANQDEISLFAEIITKLNAQIKSSHHIYYKTGQTKLQTEFGEFDLMAYQNIINYDYHLVLTMGDIKNKRNIPMRIHSSCITGDIFGSQKCDCGEQLKKSMEYIAQQKLGVLVYLFQEGRGINIINKIKAYDLQSKGLNTIEANEHLGFPSELREYDMIKDIIKDLNIKSVDLITNNPEKISKLQSIGIIIENIIAIGVQENPYNKNYLNTKKEKLGHLISINK